MVLSSQLPRPSSRSRYMSRRRRSRLGPALLGLVVIGAVGVGLWALFLRGGDPDGPADGPADGPGPNAVVQDTARSAEDVPANGGSDAGSDRRAEEFGGGDPDPSIAGGGERDSTPAVITMGQLATVQEPAPRPADEERPAAAPSLPSPPPATEGLDESLDRALNGDLERALAVRTTDPIAARRTLTGIVLDERRASTDRRRARAALDEINQVLIFSPLVVPGDAFSEIYVIQSNDTLEKLTRARKLDTDWRFLQRINGIADVRRIREGQRVKMIVGTFHAVVHKRDYRMDVFLENDDERVFVTSMPVGLGEYDSTPVGRFGVRPRSKLVNPQWTNPRTGERFSADDPENPIGERWIGLIGLDQANQDVAGYGIHGTIDPGSIGTQASMGCVRMHGPDVELIYEILTEPDSTIEIVG